MARCRHLRADLKQGIRHRYGASHFTSARYCAATASSIHDSPSFFFKNAALKPQYIVVLKNAFVKNQLFSKTRQIFPPPPLNRGGAKLVSKIDLVPNRGSLKRRGNFYVGKGGEMWYNSIIICPPVCWAAKECSENGQAKDRKSR